MGAMASQITSLTIVYTIVCSGSGTDKKTHLSFASLAFVRGIHRGSLNSPHKRPVTRKMSLFDDVIMVSRHWHRDSIKIFLLPMMWWCEINTNLIVSKYNKTPQEAGTYILECDTFLIFVSAGLQVVVMKLTLCSVWCGTAYIMPKCDMVIGVLYSHLNVVIRMINIDLSQEQRTAPPPPKQNKTKQKTDKANEETRQNKIIWCRQASFCTNITLIWAPLCNI